MRRPHWSRVFWIATGILISAVTGALVGGFVLLSGAYNTAATRQHFGLTHWILEKGLELSVASAAEHIEVPPIPAELGATTGAACFRQHCEICHGAPGIAPSSAGTGMLPLPTGLAQAANDWTRGELFYLISKGVRMTGMPAWEYRVSAEGRWALVAFLELLPTLDRTGYERLAGSDATCTPAAGAGDVLVEQDRRDDPGRAALRQYGCIACHIIGDMVGPPVHIGPPLVDWSRRKLIAGAIPNTPSNLARWIQAPRQLVPDTLMPDMGVTPEHAVLMADFLFGSGLRETRNVGEPER